MKGIVTDDKSMAEQMVAMVQRSRLRIEAMIGFASRCPLQMQLNS